MTPSQISVLASDVFKALGPGHAETVYVRALTVGLTNSQIPFELERTFPLTYKDVYIGTCRPDLIIDKTIVVEVKCVAQLSATHKLQLQRYLRLPLITQGLLINFGPHEVDSCLFHAGEY